VNWLALRKAEGLASIFEPWTLTVPFDRIGKRKLWWVRERGEDDRDRARAIAYPSATCRLPPSRGSSARLVDLSGLCA
jgi:hypothetical protein